MLSIEEVYKEYSDMIYRWILARTGDELVAEEITQETFYQAVKSADKFDGRSGAATWLCGIAKNCLRVYRRKTPETAELSEEAFSEHAPSAEAEAAANEARAALYRRLHALEEAYRGGLYLRLFAGLPYKEIGGIFGKTENWARVTFYRGKEKLKEKQNDEK